MSLEPATGTLMPSHLLSATGLAVMLLAVACAEPPTVETDAIDAHNVLLADWTGPHGGVPAFDRMDLDSLKPALEAGMTRHLDQIVTIASNPDPPTFENTIVALERTGRDLNRVSTYLGVWSSNISTPEFREIQREMAPRLAEFRSKITQNGALFARIKAVSDGEEMAALRPDQQRLVRLTYDDFARNGATLDGEANTRYAAIEQRWPSCTPGSRTTCWPTKRGMSPTSPATS